MSAYTRVIDVFMYDCMVWGTKSPHTGMWVTIVPHIHIFSRGKRSSHHLPTSSNLRNIYLTDMIFTSLYGMHSLIVHPGFISLKTLPIISTNAVPMIRPWLTCWSVLFNPKPLRWRLWEMRYLKQYMVTPIAVLNAPSNLISLTKEEQELYATLQTDNRKCCSNLHWNSDVF